jgi:hypothetical protein
MTPPAHHDSSAQLFTRYTRQFESTWTNAEDWRP